MKLNKEQTAILNGEKGETLAKVSPFSPIKIAVCSLLSFIEIPLFKFSYKHPKRPKLQCEGYQFCLRHQQYEHF